MTQRTERMLDSVPPYYQFSNIFNTIQAAQAADYDTIDAKNDDLQQQMSFVTATWGLKYYEIPMNIPTIESDSYEIRRSRILSKWRGQGKFSAALIKSVCEAYTNGTVSVTVDIAAQEVTVQFLSMVGVPSNLWDLKAVINNIIHAHLGIVYKLRYLVIDDAQAMTINQIQAHRLTDFAPFNPVQ